MEYRYRLNPSKCILAIASSLLFFSVGGCLLYISRWGSALIFVLLGLVFSAIAIHSGAVVRVDSTGITQLLLGRKFRELLWTQVAEVGVVGTKVFNLSNPSKAGSLYIYFSPTTMTDEERFDMIVKWPPPAKMYMAYDDRRLEAVQSLWDAKVQTYNIGKLML